MNRSARFHLWVLEKLLGIVRAYFIGKTVHWMTNLDGQIVYRAEGKIVGGIIKRDHARNVDGMNLLWAQPGRSETDLRRVSITAIVRDKTLGWVFYD